MARPTQRYSAPLTFSQNFRIESERALNLRPTRHQITFEYLTLVLSRSDCCLKKENHCEIFRLLSYYILFDVPLCCCSRGILFHFFSPFLVLVSTRLLQFSSTTVPIGRYSNFRGFFSISSRSTRSQLSAIICRRCSIRRVFLRGVVSVVIIVPTKTLKRWMSTGVIYALHSLHFTIICPLVLRTFRYFDRRGN